MLVSVSDGVASVTNLFKAIVLGSVQPPSAPTLSIRSLQSDGKLALDIAGSLGAVLFVESTSDFTTWTTVQQVIGQGSGVPVRVTVQPGQNIPALFWRVRAGQSSTAPTLSFEPLQADGSLVLVVTGPSAATIFLESSPDLTNWSTAQQVTGLGSGIPVKVTAKPELGTKARFWRVLPR